MYADAKISTAVLIVLLLQGLFSVALPVGALIFWKSKYRLNFRPFLMGIASFFIFALVGQQALHFVVLDLNPAVGAFFEANPWLNALYVGLAAGFFEETARLMMFKKTLQQETERENAVLYGIGHGGVECIVALGLTVFANFFIALALNMGNMAEVMETMSPEEAAGMLETVKLINDIPMDSVIFSVIERICMFMLQLELSVLVFAAVRQNKLWLYPVSIAAHAAVELLSTLYRTEVFGMWLTEVLIILYVALLMIPVVRIYRTLDSLKPKKVDKFGRPVTKKAKELTM
ncbi:MAG: YhfC family intramembrane metalloprotease [Clostridia bacterium]|nr:YhfC family intramembrane metalloprotease [Clostridia bacterium]